MKFKECAAYKAIKLAILAIFIVMLTLACISFSSVFAAEEYSTVKDTGISETVDDNDVEDDGSSVSDSGNDSSDDDEEDEDSGNDSSEEDENSDSSDNENDDENNSDDENVNVDEENNDEENNDNDNADDNDGTTPPEGSTAPDGTTPPEGSTAPDGTTPPEGSTAPDGTTPPEGSTAPDGTTPPEGSTAPDGTTPPEGSTAPDGTTPPENAPPASEDVEGEDGSGSGGSSTETDPDLEPEVEVELTEEELAELERLEQERLEQERLEAELLEQQRLKAELLEQQRSELELAEFEIMSMQLMTLGLEDAISTFEYDNPNNYDLTVSDSGSYGNFELILPTNTYYYNGTDIGDGVTSDMTAIIYVKTDNTSVTEPLYFIVAIYDGEDNSYTAELMEFTFAWSSNDIPYDAGVSFPVHYVKLTDLSPGSTVYVNQIAISGTQTTDYGTWTSENSWTSAQVGVYLTNILDADGNDLSETVTIVEGTSNPQILSESGVNVIKYMNHDIALDDLDLYYQNESSKTLKTEDHYSGGYKTYEYLDILLNSFNVFSFKDVEGTHIVGPIVAKNEAYYKRSTPVSTVKSSSKLIFADYSRGTPSYIGNLSTRSDGNRDSAANYDYDRDYDSSFTEPYLYTSYSTWLINNGNEYWLQEYVVTPAISNLDTPYSKLETDDKTASSTIAPFLSPNNSGSTEVMHNSSYIDFDAYAEAIYDECVSLLEEGQDENGGGSIEDYPMEQYTYDSTTDGSILTVEPGECWTITDASQLEQINIVLAEGEDYFTSSSLSPLTINFACTTINTTTIDGKTVSQFPLITINGEEFDSEGSGETIEYNEFGNKLIFNMPYVTGTVVTYSTSSNIPGHMLMPNAEFWNITENSNGALEWEGGNINGLLLAADVHLGETEMHMWAYGGLESQSTTYRLELTKTVNGSKPADGSEFEFELYSALDNQTGLYNSSFPLTATSDADGNVQFGSLIFTAAGTYYFYVSEAVAFGSSSMDYDLSQYELIVTVDTAFNVSATFTQVKDRYGDEISVDDQTTVTKIIFDNLDSSPVLPSTGGSGTDIYILTGLALMILAGTNLKKSMKC